MPAFNSSRTIGAAILGIVNQSYRDWELVIVDDGSDDDLAPEIEMFADSRIHLHRMASNSGVGAALNQGLGLCKGRFIARMDSDDWMEEWRIAEQLRFILIEGLTVCGTDAMKFGLEVGSIRNPRKGRQIIDTFLTNNPFVHPTVMFDRQKLGSELRYNEDFRCEEDYELWSRVLTPDNCGNMEGESIRYRVRREGNANHPTKRDLKTRAVWLFARRLGIANVLPVNDISEFLLNGTVKEAAFPRLVAYAEHAAREGLPLLGALQGPLREYSDFESFNTWLTTNLHVLRPENERLDP